LSCRWKVITLMRIAAPHSMSMGRRERDTNPERNPTEPADTSSGGPRGGDRHVVASDFEGAVSIQSRAPFRSGAQRRLPVGLNFVLLIDPRAIATVYVRPDPCEQCEALLVDEQDC
jgi:hypothetical protein